MFFVNNFNINKIDLQNILIYIPIFYYIFPFFLYHYIFYIPYIKKIFFIYNIFEIFLFINFVKNILLIIFLLNYQFNKNQKKKNNNYFFIFYGIIGSFILIITTILYQYNINANNLIQIQHQLSFLEFNSFKLIYFLMIVIMSPLIEEYYFRELLYQFLKQKYKMYTVMFINSLLFALMHNSILYFLNFFLINIIMCCFYEKTKNITTTIIMHCLFNLYNITYIILY